MITFQIKKKWFDMIVNEKKKEEYREIKPYYYRRLGLYVGKTIDVKFRNGYSPKSPSITCKCNVRIGTGKTEWGAEKDKEYYILEIKEV